MKRCITHILCLLVAIINSTSIKAQIDPCLTLLKDARQYSDKGLYDQAISKATQAISSCALSKNDKIEAYKLLFLNYTAIDNLELAEDAVANILKINPNYEPDKQKDTPELITTFQKYKPTIIMCAFLQGGMNYGLITTKKTYSVVAANNSQGLDNYELLGGWQLGAGLEYRVKKNLAIRLSGNFRQSGYRISLNNIQGQTVNYEENINFLDVTPGTRYYFGNGRLQPFVSVNGQFSFMLTSLGRISRSEESDLVDRSGQRKSFLAGYGAEAGITYSKKGFQYQLSFGYNRYTANIVNPENRFDNLDIVFKYYYLDNDFSMSNVQLNASVAYAIRYKNMLLKDQVK